MPADEDGPFATGWRGCLVVALAAPFILASTAWERLRGRRPARRPVARKSPDRWRGLLGWLLFPIGVFFVFAYDDVGNRFASSYRSRLTGRPVRSFAGLIAFTVVYLTLILAAIGFILWIFLY